MNQFISFWQQLGLRRQIIVVAATIAMFFAILGLSRMVSAPSMSLLYAGLENGAAGDVVRALEQRGVAYEVRGGSIFVDGQMRDELRLTLASEGLPANGSRGYELLDSLTGFGTTAQMFDAAYWRAKEGELARTLVASPQIAMARVHIAQTGANPFQRGVSPKASVLLSPVGGNIGATQANAVRFLVASAIAGLAPEDVAVIDSNGSLIGQADDAAPSIGGEDRAQVLKDRVQRLLEARVGFGNAIVEVSVDTVTESETINERRVLPESRVAVSTETEERSTSATEAANPDVTVASNLPDEDGAGGGGSGSSQNSETRERVDYQVSQTEREIVRAAGAIRRVTVAVLVNDPLTAGTDGTASAIPRSEEELTALRDLVASAVGFDEARGDVITIKSMALQSVPLQGTEVENSFLSRLDVDLMSIIQMAILAAVTLILGLFVLRPLLARPQPAQQNAALPVPVQDSPGDSDIGTLEPLGDLASQVYDEADGDLISDFSNPPADLPDFPIGNQMTDDPVARLRAMIGERQEETVEILRGWLEEKEERV